MSTAIGSGQRSSRTLVLLALGAVAALGLGVGAWLQIGSQPEGLAAAPSPTAAAGVVRPPSPSPFPSPSPSIEGLANPTFSIFEVRDPFDQLVTEAAADGTGSAGSSSGAGGAASPAPTSSSPSFGQPTSTPSPSPAPAPTGQVGGTSVEVMDTYVDEDGRETVQVAVNGTGYDVHEGETFANDNGRVLSIDAPCATVEYQQSPMTLCESDQIYK